MPPVHLRLAVARLPRDRMDRSARVLGQHRGKALVVRLHPLERREVPHEHDQRPHAGAAVDKRQTLVQILRMQADRRHERLAVAAERRELRRGLRHHDLIRLRAVPDGEHTGRRFHQQFTLPSPARILLHQRADRGDRRVTAQSRLLQRHEKAQPQIGLIRTADERAFRKTGLLCDRLHLRFAQRVAVEHDARRVALNRESNAPKIKMISGAFFRSDDGGIWP